MKKRIFAFVTAMVLCLGLAAPAHAAVGLDNFAKVYAYTEQFTDVAAGAWYHGSVAAAYEYGLMNGVTYTSFDPDGYVTIAQALALASRLRDVYYGGRGVFVQGYPWYQVYLNYAVENGIITTGQYGDYRAAASRKDFARILAAAFPEEALPPINHVTAIPDVDRGAEYGAAVYLLYNAGVLTGDMDATFRPDSAIKRSEVAAIAVRMVDVAQRRTLAIEEPQQNVFDFLQALAETRGERHEYSSGGVYYSYCFDVRTDLFATASGRQFESSLYLSSEPDGSLSISVYDGLPSSTGEGYDSTYYTLISFDRTLTAPYEGWISFTYDGAESGGILRVEPSTLTKDATLAFATYDGELKREEDLARSYAESICKVLQEAEKTLLIPYGHTLRDLGFTALAGQ